MELKVICKKLITQNLDGNITEGEYGADVVGISVPRIYGKHDLSVFSFRLTAISMQNESIAEQVLTMDSIDEKNIHLLWNVTSDFTAVSGEVTLILAGVNTNNTVQIKFISQPVTINDDYRLEFIESPTILEQACNQVQLEVQKAIDAAERAEEASLKPAVVCAATETEIGGVLSGGDIIVAENGIATVNSVNGKTVGTSVPENAIFTDTVYTLPTASDKVLGGVKVDNKTIEIDVDGIISAVGGTNVESVKRLSSNSSYQITDTVSYPLLALSLYGNSTQDGTPTPDAPVDIVSVGDDGAVEVTVDNSNDISLLATITSGLPLCSVGDYHDELIYNADGTGKIIKCVRKVVLDGSEANWIMYTTINGNNRPSLNFGVDRCIYGNYTTSSPSLILCDKYKSVSYLEITTDIEGIGLHHIEGRYLSIYDENFATASIDEWKAHLAANPLTIIYVLNTPQEIELSAAEMTLLQKLQTFDSITNIHNNEGAEMDVKICTNKDFSECVYPLIKSLLSKLQ